MRGFSLKICAENSEKTRFRYIYQGFAQNGPHDTVYSLARAGFADNAANRRIPKNVPAHIVHFNHDMSYDLIHIEYFNKKLTSDVC
jgi:hypothetical protein